MRQNRIRKILIEMSGGSARELAALLWRLRDERPELYRAFVAGGCTRVGPRADDAPRHSDAHADDRGRTARAA